MKQVFGSKTRVFERLYLKGIRIVYAVVESITVYYSEDNENKRAVFEVLYPICSFPLIEMSESEILKKRKAFTPGIVLKRGEKLYFAKLFEDIKISNHKIESQHLCASCARCYGLPTSEGGCDKIFDPEFVPVHIANKYYPGYYTEKSTRNIAGTKRIEKYPFIIGGFQTLYSNQGAFIVGKCSNFCPSKFVKPETRGPAKRNYSVGG